MLKKVLIVDDSALMRRVIRDIIESDDRFSVNEIARDGLEAFQFILDHQYDIIVLDINMPRMTGLELLEQLQKSKIKIPTIMVSTVARAGTVETIRALELGAFDFVTKPENFIEAKGNDFRTRLLNMLRIAGEVDSPSLKSAVISHQEPMIKRSYTDYNRSVRQRADSKNNKIIALACSTGGPKSLQSVIPYLPEDLDAPVLIVQHMPSGFTNSLAVRLNEISPIRVKEAADGEPIEKGCVYIAPGGKHMKVQKGGPSGHRIQITDEPPVGGLRPYANLMYNSLINSDYDEIVCVILTGMGGDGTEGIKNLKRKKEVYVVAQDEETCVVFGMPKTVIEAGLANQITALNKVPDAIIKNVGVY